MSESSPQKPDPNSTRPPRASDSSKRPETGGGTPANSAAEVPSTSPDASTSTGRVADDDIAKDDNRTLHGSAGSMEPRTWVADPTPPESDCGDAEKLADGITPQLILDAINAANNMICVSDVREPDQPLVFANNYFCESLGYSRKEIVGKNCRFLQTDGDGNRDTDQGGNLELVREAIRDGKNARVQLRNYKADGEEFINELYLSPIFGDDGEVTHFIGVQNDITRQAWMQTTLHQQSRRFEMVLNSAPTMIGLVHWNNERWEHVLVTGLLAEFVGLDRNQIEDRTFFEMNYPDELARVLDDLCLEQRHLRMKGVKDCGDGPTHVRQEVFVGGRRRVVDIRSDCVVAAPAEPSVIEKLLRATNDLAVGEQDVDLWCYVIEDVTDWLETNRELEEIQEQFVDVQEAEQRRIGRDLHDGVAQEMLATAMYCKAIEQKYAKRNPEIGDDLRTASQMAARAVSRTRRAIRGLLPDEVEEADLVTALRALVDETNEAFQLADEFIFGQTADNAAAEGQDPSELPCVLVVEQLVELSNQTQLVELYRIVAEGLANARKHSGSDEIIVRVGSLDGDASTRPGDQGFIEVEDHGTGLPSEFDQGQMSGIGLRSIKIRAARIGGDVSLFSVPDEGTRLRIEFTILPVDKLTHPSAAVNKSEDDSWVHLYARKGDRSESQTQPSGRASGGGVSDSKAAGSESPDGG